MLSSTTHCSSLHHTLIFPRHLAENKMHFQVTFYCSPFLVPLRVTTGVLLSQHPGKEGKWLVCYPGILDGAQAVPNTHLKAVITVSLW